MHARVRVLHIYSGNLYGGIETLLITLAKYAQGRTDLQLEFAICFDGRLSADIGVFQRVHILGDVRIRFPWTWLQARRRLRSVLAAGKFDAVICHAPWSHAIFAPVVKRAGMPVVLCVHDATDGQFWLERLAHRTKPDLVICNSRFTAGTADRLFPGIPVSFMYWPVPPQPSLGRGRAEIRAQFNTPDSDVVIIQVSRLEPWKGHRLHLQALSRLSHLPNWTCWQVGGLQKRQEHEYLSSLKKQAASLGLAGRIRFLGQRSDVPDLLSAADIHCQPNEGPEPFGRTFIEALSAGLPVVTTAMGAAVEIVDSSCGILVPPADPDALSNTLSNLITNPSLRANYASGSRMRAAILCDPDRQLLAFTSVLRSVLEHHRAA